MLTFRHNGPFWFWAICSISLQYDFIRLDLSKQSFFKLQKLNDNIFHFYVKGKEKGEKEKEREVYTKDWASEFFHLPFNPEYV